MDGITLKTGQALGSQFTDSMGGVGSKNRINSDSQFQIQTPSSGSTELKSFSETLNQAIDKVNTLQKDSDKGMQNLATGRSDNIADVMITAEKADIALKVMVQVRNKIIDAYQEMMRMQV